MSHPRPSLAQDLIWRLEAAAYVAVFALLRLMTLEMASALGGWLAVRLGPLTGSHKVVQRNLRLAFPEMSEAEREAIARQQWDNLGRSTFELPFMEELQPHRGRVQVEGAERLEEIRTSGKPVVFISGHFSNWEVMPCTIVDAGITCQMTYRAANNPHVDKLIREARARYGVQLFAPKGSEGSRELLAAMQRGESVALMNDQKFNGGVAAPFMGQLAHTAAGPTRLALRFGTVLQPMTVERLPGVRFRVVVHPPIELARTGSREADLEAGVARVNAFVEAQVRARPLEWFWVHKRWSNEAYATLDR
jgi:Kdo2-lipid IVA lauroyltransferase/acyltransferase